MYYKIEINKIIRIRHDRFWKSLYLDEKLAKSISAIYKVVRTIEVGAFVIGYIIMVLQFLKPTFLEDSPYLFYSWVFVDSLPLEVCTLAFQYCSMLLAMPSILGLDLVFLYICVDLIIQMKLVKFQLQLIIRESTLGDDGLKQIKEIVQHHLVLLS
ncbi:7tm Odorant receptor [Popillia japonica]|uniref:7tm Odorant receptor n=1 Tax=Popillia japonica TaxID=7064 RepID=A0AAW1LZ25_POPJA